MFNLGPMEMIVLFVVALIVFGPDRLPQLAKEVGRMLKTVRDLSQGARAQLAELSPELGDMDLRTLNPRTALTKFLFDGDDDPLGAKGITEQIKRAINDTDDEPATVAPAKGVSPDATPAAKSGPSLTKEPVGASSDQTPPPAASAFDSDAT